MGRRRNRKQRGPEPEPNEFQCNICKDCPQLTAAHKNTLEHRFNFTLFEYSHLKRTATSNKHGVEISIAPEVEFYFELNSNQKKGITEVKVFTEALQTLGNKFPFSCTITNTRTDEIFVTYVGLLLPSKLFELKDPMGNFDGNKIDTIVQLQPKAEYKFSVIFHLKQLTTSTFKVPLFCTFQTRQDIEESKRMIFSIARSMVIKIYDEKIQNEVKEKNVYTNQPFKDVTLTVPPTCKFRHIERYRIPQEAYHMLKRGEVGQFLHHATEVSPTNYSDYWHVLLWLEEISETLMLQRYNMENVTMRVIARSRLELKVPGLTEKRPSLIKGDTVSIRLHSDHKVYMGTVCSVIAEESKIHIEHVNRELTNYIQEFSDTELDVSYKLNRLAYERKHAGVDAVVASKIFQYLFPNRSLVQQVASFPYPTLRDSDFFNVEVRGNPEQRVAVERIFYSKLQSPYIVFGPPGTGKTVTIVEAILQILFKTAKRILVCASSNAACDNIAMKLVLYLQNSSQLIRVNAMSRERSSLPDELVPFSNVSDDKDEFSPVPPEDLATYRIVVTTLILIGKYSKTYKPDCIFIDEAAQSDEPETDIAIGLNAKQIVLAGDPRQLGPIVHSKVSKDHGFGNSLLQRLMTHSMYDTENSDFVTMLKLNFRSHATILDLPNNHFYDGQLKAVSPLPRLDPVARLAIYPLMFTKEDEKETRKDFFPPGVPIEFCSVSAKEQKEGHSPSYYNTQEVQMVFQYIKALTSFVNFGEEFPEYRVKPEHIGVVTPYKRQMYKIKQQLKVKGFADVEVGTTEAFQGREKRIIIISTVRAQHGLLRLDEKYRLGFVKDKQRINVAMTRAKCKLIVIGCPTVLETDETWKAYVLSCISQKAYYGAPYSPRTEEVKREVVHRAQKFCGEGQPTPN